MGWFPESILFLVVRRALCLEVNRQKVAFISVCSDHMGMFVLEGNLFEASHVVRAFGESVWYYETSE